MIKYEKIKTPYALLSVFLVVAESLLVYYGSISADPVERYVMIGGTIGILAIFPIFVYSIRKLDKKSDFTIGGEKIAVEDTFEPATDDSVWSPTQDYRLMKPEGEWICEKIHPSKINCDIFQIHLPWFKENIRNTLPFVNELLSFKSKNDQVAVSKTDETLINGKKSTTEHAFSLATRMTIIPLDRIQPEFGDETPFIHNRTKIIYEIMRHNFKLISDSKDEKPLIVGRKSYKYELRQKWRNIHVNGQQVNVLNINVVVIAVEGLIRDYLFVIRYPSGNYSEEKKNLIREQNAQLCKSIKTVKFHVPEDYETIKSSIKSIRDEQEDVLSLIHSNKRKFERAFEMTMNYLLKKSHSNTLDDETLIKSLKELDITAKRYGLRYKDISDLFEILEKTEKGDTEKLTSRYRLLADEYTKWQRSPEAFVPVDLLFG